MILLRSFAAFILAIASTAANAQAAPALMPLPAHMTMSAGAFVLSPDFHASVTTGDSPRLEAAIVRTMHRLEGITGLTFAKSNAAAKLTIAVSSMTQEDVDADESYSIDVTPRGIRIAAKTDLGALHALETLLQLVAQNGSAYDLPAISINDTPRFPWRGLHIDVSRHYQPMDVLKHNIDAIAAVKLNVFHWHLIDDQGFRIESKRFPKLTALGADGQFYTQEQARELVAYAHARGIRVMPEFEMPGHSSAWLVAYPELNSGSQPDGIRREFGVSPFVLDPTRDATYTFLEAFLTEMAGIFPDPYIHIGGDEAPAPDWKTNPRILDFMKAHSLRDNAAMQAYFNQRVLAILTGLHKRMVGWDEILNPALPKNVVVQSWRGLKSLGAGAQQGYQGILSAGYYLDHMDPASLLYLNDPVPADSSLSPAQRKLILGGEVCMWGEFVDDKTIDSRIWPRAAAVAERLWSPQDHRDVQDMYRRLEAVSPQLAALGLTHLSHKGVALQEIAGTVPMADLATFANAFEPATFGERARLHQNTTQTPLTQFIDAIVPDPPIKHQLIEAARVVAAKTAHSDSQTKEAREFLKNFFDAESQAAKRIASLLPGNARLAPLATRERQLIALAARGNEALGYAATGGAPAGWKHTLQSEIQAAMPASGLVHFDFLEALTLLEAAAY